MPKQILIVGDFNCYENEDPIDTLMSRGLVLKSGGSYSYGFEGQYGALDHVFVSPELDSLVTGVTTWHINADEPRVLDYNTENNPAFLYDTSVFRSSDHDPVIIGLDIDIPGSLADLLGYRLDISVYPVPSSNTVHFDFKQEEGEKLSLQIFDALGKLVYKHTQTSGTGIHWSPSGASSVYFYRLIAGSKLASGKIIRQLK